MTQTQTQPLLVAETATLHWLNPQLLDLDGPQPRQDFGSADAKTADAELAADVRQRGVLVPLLVVTQPDGRFLVVAGARRRNAALAADREQVPCMVLTSRPSPREWLDYQLVENLHRRELAPLELAQTVWRRWLLTNIEALEREQGDDGTATNTLVQQASTPAGQIDQLQQRLTSLAGVATLAEYLSGGKVRVSRRAVLEQLGFGDRSESWAKKLLKLLKLDPAVQGQLDDLDVPANTLRDLAQRDPDEQQALVQKAREQAAEAGGAERHKGRAAKRPGAGVSNALRKELGKKEDRTEQEPSGEGLEELEPPPAGRPAFDPDPQLAFPSGRSKHASRLITDQVAPERGTAPPTRPVGTWDDSQVLQLESALEAIRQICEDAGVLRLGDRQVRRLQPSWSTTVDAVARAGLRAADGQ